MTIDTFLVKRRALYLNEVGLFPSSPMAQEDFSILSMDDQLMVHISSPKNIEALRYLWSLVHKIADNTDFWTDRYKAMEALLKRVHYAKFVYDPETKQIEVRAKSLRRISNEELRRVTDAIVDVACKELITGMKPNDLRKEIEEMVGAA